MSPDIVGRLRPPRLASAPASPAPGEEYFNSTGNTLQFWNGTAWISMTPTAGGGTPVLTASQVRDVGVANQIRAGRQLTAADFTALGLSAPAGLWNLSDLTDASGNGRALSNRNTVTFASGINGAASTAAQFTGADKALYISDTGAADPFRIKTGSWGCWFRTAKRTTGQAFLTKWGASVATASFWIGSNSSNNLQAIWADGATNPVGTSVSDICDDRWHFGVITLDGATVRLYVDGVLEASIASSIILNPNASAPLNIGAQQADGSTAAVGSHFGRIDEAFVTADVLSADQVRGLYCAKIAHGLGAVPSTFNLSVRRARKGAALDPVADFPGGQPVRLHNFTAGALTDQGTGNVTLTNNGAAVAVAGADGSTGGAFNFVAASSQSLSSTDAGLPSGTVARSFGAWFKTTQAAAAGCIIGWGTTSTADSRLLVGASGGITSNNGADGIAGPFAADGQWHYGVVVEDNAAGDGVKRKLYMDGLLVGTSTTLNTITLLGANSFRVGANPNASTFFAGQIDGAFVCAYALTQDQVSTLYAKGGQQLSPSPKNAGDHVEYADSSSVYMVLDTLDSQNAVDLGVS